MGTATIGQSSPAPARRRPRGSKPPSEDARERILEAALELFALHGLDGMSLQTMADKVGLINELDRYAVVGGPGWVAGMARAVGALMTPDIRVFDLDQRAEAEAWLSES